MVLHLSDSGEQHDPVKAWLHSNVPLFVRELLAGGAAGAVAKTCVAPLERTKILLMTGRSQTSAYGTLRLILSKEGVWGLFRGNSASCLRIMPYAAVHFSVYEVYRRLLTEDPLASLSELPSPTPRALGPAPTSVPSGPCAEANAGGGQVGMTAAVGKTGASVMKGVVQAAAQAVPPVALTSSIDVAATTAISVAEEELLTEQSPPPPLPPLSSSSSAAAVMVADGLPPAMAVPPPASPSAAGTTPPRELTATVNWGMRPPQQQQQPRGRPHHSPVVDLMAGSAAGTTAVLLTYPLDVVRTRLAWAMEAGARPFAVAAGAASTAVAPPLHQSRIVPMIAHIVRHEGFFGMYRGLAPTLYGIMPYAGLKFFVYSSLKQWYRDSLQPRPKPAAAATSVALSTHESGGSGSESSIGNGSSHGSGGVGGRARDSGVAVSHQRHGGDRLPVPHMLAFGGVSGLFAQTVTYPLDVIRRRMQVYGMQKESQGAAAASPLSGGGGTAAAASLSSKPTTWSTAVAIVRQEGLKGLLRGMSINYIKVIPSTAIGFTTYEVLKSYLGVTGNL